jgi:bifunctional non-homologous end joining protein LigD
MARGTSKEAASNKATPRRASKLESMPRSKAKSQRALAAIQAEQGQGDYTSNPVKSRARTFAVTLTHPGRIYWPDVDLTKQGLAEYYADVWKWMAPHVVARPLALLRCPGGIAEPCFFQKQPWKGLHKSIAVLRNPGAGGDHFLAIEDFDGVVAMVQAGVLEIHPWGATVGDLDHPDRLIFDLDPGPHLDWAALIDAAAEVRERLERDGLESFVKTSGGKGLHVVAPLRPEAGWDAAKSYAKGIAEAMANDDPQRYTAVISKAAREQKIFVDYLRNARGATAVAPYSTRARAGAPVSTPLAWEELGPKLRGNSFNVGNIRDRLSRLRADPWASFFKLAQTLPAAATGRRTKRKPK